MWAAVSVALAVIVATNVHRSLAQESTGTSTGATANQANQKSTTSDATQQNDSQAPSQSATESAAADQSAPSQASTSSDAASDSASGAQGSQAGPALPPPDSSGQQGRTEQPRSVPAQDQPVHRDQAVPSQPETETAAAAQGQSDIRGDTRDRDVRDQSLRDPAMHDQNLRGQDFRDRMPAGMHFGIRFGAPTGRGLVIATIDRNSVFFDSGLRQGDVLISLHGRPIRNEAEFVRFVRLYPGQRIPVVVLRDGRQQTVFLTYDQQVMPQDPTYQTAQPNVSGSQPFLGVLFDTQLADGALVRDVTPGSPAEHAGLRPGDMITALNGQQVSSYPDAIQLIRMMRPGDQLVIDYSRRVNDQTQALLAGRPGDMVRTAAAPQPAYQSQLAPAAGPVPVYPDQPAVYPDGGIERDPWMIDRERGVRQPLRDRPLLPRLRN
jgi:hypothetical protein